MRNINMKISHLSIIFYFLCVKLTFYKNIVSAIYEYEEKHEFHLTV